MSLRMKKKIQNLMLIFASMSLTLLVSECILRVTGAGNMTVSPDTLFRSDRDVGWICTPNVNERYFTPGSFDVRVICNSHGLRDSEKGYAKPPETWRIEILGDSYAWGFGVENEEMVSTVLQNLIPNAETINFGVKGYSTLQEVLRLETEGLRYKPDLTLLFFCRNDLEDNFDDKEMKRPALIVTNDNVLKIRNRPVQRHYKSPIKQWFQRNSRVYLLSRYGIKLLKSKRKEKRRLGVIKSKHQLANVPSPNKKNGGKIEFSLAEIYAPPTINMERAWKAMSLLLARARNLAATDGGRLVVVYVAAKEAMDNEVFTTEMEKAGFDPDSELLDWDRPSNNLGQICATLDIPYVNLTPVFRRHPKPFSLFLKKDGHWSTAGHQLAAEIVAARIEPFRKQ